MEARSLALESSDVVRSGGMSNGVAASLASSKPSATSSTISSSYESGLYRSPHAALQAAYGALARPSYASASFWRGLLGSTIRGPAMSRLDRVAQASMTLQRARLTLRPDMWILVEARYRLDVDADARARKERDVGTLADQVAAARDVVVDSYSRDVVREWCGLRPTASPDQWSHRLGKHRATLHRWRCQPYRPQRRPGIMTVLDNWHDIAMNELGYSFRQAGIC